jgi:murein DD-endopeptidase MepM/ murein hydrolase activator NlpD
MTSRPSVSSRDTQILAIGISLALLMRWSHLHVAAADAIHIELQARAVKPGEVVVMTIEAPADAEPVHVAALGHAAVPFQLAAGRWRALLGIDLDVKPGTYPISIDAGTLHAAKDLLVQPKTFGTRRLTVNPDFVTPPPSAAERIARDAELMAATWRSSPPKPLWSGAFARPVHEAANSAFGTRSIFNGAPRNAHGGADFLSPAGTPVKAPNAGRVAIARDLYYSGNTVVLDHGAGLFSMLAHLSAIEVAEGEQVERGALVGRVGATGRVTGAHLHWAVRLNDARVDPLSLLAVLGTQ